MDFQSNKGYEVFEWLYPVHYEKTIHVNTDVLVIGGLAKMENAIGQFGEYALIQVCACSVGCINSGGMPCRK